MSEKGQISIHTDNILPIIKKWLYAEKDIYLRELVSNASDAISKLEHLNLVGEAKDIPESKITVAIDKAKKTLTITDTGIGMTEDEIKKYINQIAFSGVQEFVEKYQGKDDENQIIGHFGLGFYSAFMVSETVEIETKSFKEGEGAVRWSCSGDTEYTLEKSDRKETGTSIILHIGEDSMEMLEEAKIMSLLNRYCAFIRHPIEMNGKVINDPKPIWTRSASELEDKDYLDLFSKLFPGSQEPLFWIHLNLDYPFNLRGVLFFPKLGHEFEANEGQVKLYCNQVFVADNAKEVVPEYLTVLKGVLDCPDLPLNVSRSYLNTDPQVRKISEHITKKVADKLVGLAKTDMPKFESFWTDLHGFTKYAILRDQKFYERLKDYLIYKSTSGSYTTLNDLLERVGTKTDGKIIYVSDETAQAPYVAMFKEQGLEAIVADTVIDKHFLPYLEAASDKKFKFERIDADVTKYLVDDEATDLVNPNDKKTSSEKLETIFKNNLEKEGVTVRIETLKSEKMPAMLLLPESARRAQELGHFLNMGALAGAISGDKTLVVNAKCPAVKKLLDLDRGVDRGDDIKVIVNHIYDLAYLQQGDLTPEGMEAFVNRSVEVMGRLT